MASARRKRNNITKLSNTDGELISDQDGMCSIAKECFVQIFKQGTQGVDEVTTLLQDRVTNDDNQSLTKDFVIDEFK
jgi:hypothetical protein